MLGPHDLVLCSGTLLETSLREKIEAASNAGFQGISLWADDVERAHADGLSNSEIKSLIADHGLAVAELDPLLSWLSTGSLGSGAAAGSEALMGHGEDVFYAIADTIGGSLINCAHPFPGEVEQRVERRRNIVANLC